MNVTRTQVLALFRSLNRHLRKIGYKQDTNSLNQIFLNFVRQQFRENKTLTDKQQIYKLYKQGEEYLFLIEGLKNEVVCFHYLYLIQSIFSTQLKKLECYNFFSQRRQMFFGLFRDS
jgi:hypothetical protein